QSVPDLPSPLRTWEESKLYLLKPLEKRGEMDQGIVLLAYYSLVRVSKGFLLGILLGTPLGLLLGMSKTLHRMFDPIIQLLRPIERGHGVAHDCRQRNADRHAGRRRISVAAVQQPHLRSHPTRHHHDRRVRVRARSPDGHGRNQTQGDVAPVAFIEVSALSK